MKLARLFILFCSVFSFVSCQQEEEKTAESLIELAKNWRVEILVSEEVTIPFEFELQEEGGSYSVDFINAGERLHTKGVRVTQDSLIIPGYVFATELRAKIIDGITLEGLFVRFDRGESYEIPFKASANQNFRTIENPEKASFDFNGKWEVNFANEEDTTFAIGKFQQNGNKVSGTFLTATGDYRFLQGEVSGNEMQLSTFDGSHLFLFKATGLENGKLEGGFWSGNHWHEKWTAVRNENAVLPDPNTLTTITGNDEVFHFAFPTIDGDTLRLADEQFEDKVVLVQIMGTWCPNCMDETRFLVELKDKYPELEIVGVAFENHEGEVLKNHIEGYKEKLNVTYSIVIGGKASKKIASEAFPMLSGITSFPTTILIDKDKHIRFIHTGFNGPGTGEVYKEFVKEFTEKVEELTKK